MKKEEMTQEIGAQLATLRETAQNLTKLCDSLQNTIRSGDVAVTTVEEAKRMVEGIKANELKVSLDKTFKTLKARVVARVKEI